jgi:hypothetical protein
MPLVSIFIEKLKKIEIFKKNSGSIQQKGDRAGIMDAV